MQFIKKMFQGRIGRKKFLLPALLLGVLPSLTLFHEAYTAVIVHIPGAMHIFKYLMYPFVYPYLLLPDSVYVMTAYFLLICPALLLPWAVRRLHDIEENGWFSVIVIVPFINTLFILFLLIVSGKRNQRIKIPLQIGVFVLVVTSCAYVMFKTPVIDQTDQYDGQISFVTPINAIASVITDSDWNSKFSAIIAITPAHQTAFKPEIRIDSCSKRSGLKVTTLRKKDTLFITVLGMYYTYVDKCDFDKVFLGGADSLGHGILPSNWAVIQDPNTLKNITIYLDGKENHFVFTREGGKYQLVPKTNIVNVGIFNTEFK